MRSLSNRAITFLVLFLLIAAPMLGGIGPVPADDVGGSRGMVPFSDGEPVWSDTLDDLSHVYTPDGLVDVEVTGGEARLATGEVKGYIASEVIRAETGYNYNLVYLDAVLPGNSTIEISILDATKESSVVGYANDTVPSFEKKVCTDRSLTTIGCVAYPEIRIQVNLNADGTDRPRLLGWYLYYVPQGMWRDEFLGTCKMEGCRGVVLANGTLEIDTSRVKTSGGTGTYDPYPPVVLAFGHDEMNAYYPTEDGTSYRDRVQLSGVATNSVEFVDLNADGYLDLVCSHGDDGTNYVDSQIYWGDETGEWGPTGAKDLHARGSSGVATGDFNGDGEADIVIGCAGSGSTTSRVFLNQGGGDFNYEPDIDFGFTSGAPLSGDLNGDGYSDIVLSISVNTIVHYGGPDGPSTTADRTFSNLRIPSVEDIDGDGFDDLMLGVSCQPEFKIFLGGPDGLSSTEDFSLSGQGTYIYMPISAGDINGDGLIDLVGETYLDASPDVPHVYVF